MNNNSLIKYYNTLKYLKPIQIYGRTFSIIKKKLGLIRLPEIPDSLKPSLTPKTAFINHDPWNNKEKIIKGEFTFLNHTEKLSFPPKWKAEGVSLLWQFNLHYFNYLFLLNKEDQIKLCYDWIDKNEMGKGIGWHPYVISLRLISWCKLGFDDDKINKSIYIQAAFLYRNLEYYHPANHHLENARALIFAGLYFKDQVEGSKWLKKGLGIYLKETPKQVLGDGGYFERSIMYHAIILEGFLDILNILPELDSNYGLFKETTGKMINFLKAASHPDGNISLFNDSTQEIAPSVKELNDYAFRLGINSSVWQETLTEESSEYEEKKFSPSSGRRNDNIVGCHSFKDTGYYLYKDEQIYLIIDGGAIGPDFIPAHAHADIFSYELSFKGIQFIIDAGVYEYAEGEMRNYVRSTKAHNTVSIDGKDQAECWGGFRVARRYEPCDVLFKEVNEKVFFEGKFDGYAKLIGDYLIHHRKIILDKETDEITVEDDINGKGKHKVESYIHLHPEVQVEEVDNYIILTRKNISIKFSQLKTDQSMAEFEEGWYCPEFGKRIKNKMIKIYSNQLPCKLSYRFIIN